MKTVTTTKARQNLSAWLARAANGEDIGIVHSATGKIIALRTMEVYSDDYAFSEYGIEPNTPESNIHAKILTIDDADGTDEKTLSLSVSS